MKTKLLTQILIFLSFNVFAQQRYFVNADIGSDNNVGSKEKPLKTITEVTKRVNSDNQSGGAEIIISAGRYLISETALLKNNRNLSVNNRITIRAEILPDDVNWNPQLMPTIVTAVPLQKDDFGETAFGFDIEVSHVTIQGLRFLGGLDFEYMKENQLRRSYPIWRGGKNLDDLVVTQCVFMGDKNVMPLHVGVIANGNGVVVEHCVFYNCKNPVVFWLADDGVSKRDAMRNCLVYGASFSGIWTVQTSENDFVFRNNIITKSNTAWIRESSLNTKYKIYDSIIADNFAVMGYSSGPAGKSQNASDFLIFNNIKQKGLIELEMNPANKDYLHVKRGTFGAELNAGIFKK